MADNATPEEIIAQLEKQVSDLTTRLDQSQQGWWLRVCAKIKGYRTMVVATVLAVIPAVIDYWGGLDTKTLFGISPQTSAYIGLVFVILRVITTGPVPPLNRS